MMDFKLFSVCPFCKKRRIYISRKKVPLSIGKIATSQKLMCTSCHKKVLQMIQTNKETNQ